MTSPVGQKLRRQVIHFMDDLSIPKHTSGDELPIKRSDGISEFTKHWCVRGDHENGVFASFSDRDDIIEFGVLERQDGQPINLLHATLVLEDQEAGLNCISETSMEFNFDVYVSPDNAESLQKTLEYFATHLHTQRLSH